jgi:phage I-like protein
MSDERNQFQFISQLSAMPADGLARIPILVTGSWVKGGREVSFTRDELCTAIENFHKLANHDLNVDYDHASEDLERAAGAPTPSAGSIVALDEPEEFSNADCRLSIEKQSSDPSPSIGNRQSTIGNRYILYGRYEPTARARQMIKNREYRYVSAAFAKDYPDRKTGESQGLTLTSVALTNQPFLDELPEIWLSVTELPIDDCRFSIARQSAHRDSSIGNRQSAIGNSDETAIDNRQFTPRLSAEQGGSMAKLNLKCSAEGAHEAYDGDRKVGEIENNHLYEYAAKHAGKEGSSAQGNLSARRAGPAADGFATFAREVGAEGRSREEIRGLVTLALHPAEAELTLLSETIGAGGKLDNNRLDELDDSGMISRSGWRRAKDAEQRVQNAFSRGQITPAMMATGAPLRLALSDGAAFKALIEDRPPIVKSNTTVGIGGSGSETGESPRQLFSKLVENKKKELLQADASIGALNALRKAGALVAKENPELLRDYRADAKSA